MSEEEFKDLAERFALLVNVGRPEKAGHELARFAHKEYCRGANERRLELYDILASAVVTEDAGDFVKGLIKKAKDVGLTEDGLTLTTEGQMVVGITRKTL